jgi:outer membrane lipoprotein-sorting protein
MVRGLESATSFHFVQTTIKDGKEMRAEIWYRKPDKLRKEWPDECSIDDGRRLLKLDKKTHTAQVSESLMAYGTAERSGITELPEMFRQGDLPDGVTLVQLREESTAQTLVYTLASKTGADASRYAAKIRVRADSLLLERVESTDNTTGMKMRIEVNYAPIADATFSTVVPEGYKEVAGPERGKLTGRVVDEKDQPVAGATVYAADVFFDGRARANDRGEFTIELEPPGAPHERVCFPLFLRAFHESRPDLVGWTLLRSPDHREPLPGAIPGEDADVKVEGQQSGGSFASASGIVLRLGPATSIGGAVTDPDGKPIPGAQVRVDNVILRDRENGVCLPTGMIRLGGPAATSDEQGRYRLSRLPLFWVPSTVDMQASARGYASRQQRLTIGESAWNEHVDFKLPRAGITVTGRLVDDRGDVLVNRHVSVLVNGERIPDCGTNTDARGRFRLENCPDVAVFQLEAWLSGSPSYGQATSKTWYYLDVFQDVPRVANQAYYDVTLTAKRPDVTLQVQVKNIEEQPLAGFPVEVDGDAIPLSWKWAKFMARTDAHGQCTFTEVPRTGNLHVRVWGYTQMPPNEQLTAEGRAVADEHKKRYGSIVDIPVELTPDKSTYTIDATALSRDERKKGPR